MIPIPAEATAPGPRRLVRRARTAAWATLAAAGALSPVGAARASDQQLSTDVSAANVSAYGGVVAWSRAAGKHYALVLRSAGVTTDAVVARSDEPFDPKLGPGASGGVVAVYDRCSPRCAMYELPLLPTPGRERAVLGGREPAGCALRHPSVWGAQIAFDRAQTGRRCPDSGLYLLGAQGRSRLLTRIRRPGETAIAPGMAAVVASGVSPDHLDVILHVQPLRGRGYTIYDYGNARAGFPGSVASVSFDRGYLHWDEIDNPNGGENGVPGATVYRARPSRRPVCQSEARSFQLYNDPPVYPLSPGAIEGLLNSTAVDAGTLYYAYADNNPTPPVGGVFQATDPPARFTSTGGRAGTCLDGVQYGDVPH